MIDLYTWPTPNGQKVHILLEELELPYKVIPINISKGDQFEPQYLAINPNNKMPTIVDSEGPDGQPYPVFESGAILLYLAEKHGRFLPKAMGPRYVVIQWLMFQMASVGPMLGQAHHFRQYAPEPIPYAIDRYTNEAARIYGVVDKRLAENEYLAGDAYTIADMATFPWLALRERQGQSFDTFPNVGRWVQIMKARPAVQRGMVLLKEERAKHNLTNEESREILFGSKQYSRR